MMNLTVVEDCLLIGSSVDIECESEYDYRSLDKDVSGYRRITVSSNDILSAAIESVISQPVVNTGGFDIGSRERMGS